MTQFKDWWIKKTTEVHVDVNSHNVATETESPTLEETIKSLPIEKQDNPWAICTAQVGREDKAKYERCVQDVKAKLGKSMNKDFKPIDSKMWSVHIYGSENGEEFIEYYTFAAESEQEAKMKAQEQWRKKHPKSAMGTVMADVKKSEAHMDFNEVKEIIFLWSEGLISPIDWNHVRVKTDKGEVTVSSSDRYSGSAGSGMASYGAIQGDWRMIERIYEDVQEAFKRMYEMKTKVSKAVSSQDQNLIKEFEARLKELAILSKTPGLEGHRPYTAIKYEQEVLENEIARLKAGLRPQYEHLWSKSIEKGRDFISMGSKKADELELGDYIEGQKIVKIWEEENGKIKVKMEDGDILILDSDRHITLAKQIEKSNKPKTFKDFWTKKTRDTMNRIEKDNVDDIMAYEDGTMSEADEIKFFQRMVNDGSVWHLQGAYGRRANELLEQGLIKPPKNPTGTDAYGNPLKEYYGRFKSMQKDDKDLIDSATIEFGETDDGYFYIADKTGKVIASGFKSEEDAKDYVERHKDVVFKAFPPFEVEFELVDSKGEKSTRNYVVHADSQKNALVEVQKLMEDVKKYAEEHDIKELKVSEMKQKSMGKAKDKDKKDDIDIDMMPFFEALARRGINPFDLITHIDGKPIKRDDKKKPEDKKKSIEKYGAYPKTGEIKYKGHNIEFFGDEEMMEIMYIQIDGDDYPEVTPEMSDDEIKRWIDKNKDKLGKSIEKGEIENIEAELRELDKVLNTNIDQEEEENIRRQIKERESELKDLKRKSIKSSKSIEKRHGYKMPEDLKVGDTIWDGQETVKLIRVKHNKKFKEVDVETDKGDVYNMPYGERVEVEKMGIEGAGPIPKSKLSRQDLEGETEKTKKAQIKKDYWGIGQENKVKDWWHSGLRSREIARKLAEEMFHGLSQDEDFEMQVDELEEEVKEFIDENKDEPWFNKDIVSSQNKLNDLAEEAPEAKTKAEQSNLIANMKELQMTRRNQELKTRGIPKETFKSFWSKKHGNE